MIEFDPVAETGKVPSPCISVCVMQTNTGWCEGCTRTLDEIAQWASATEEEKRAIWLAINQRRASGGVPS